MTIPEPPFLVVFPGDPVAACPPPPPPVLAVPAVEPLGAGVWVLYPPRPPPPGPGFPPLLPGGPEPSHPPPPPPA